MKRIFKYIMIILIPLFLMIFNKFYINKDLKNDTIKKEKNTVKVVDENNIGDVSNNVNPSSWVATDGIGRTIITNKTKTNNHYRAVGIFYWTWHLAHNGGTAMNVNNINKANPDKKNDWTWWTNNYATAPAYWWNEPIYGYYMENDDYVLRKQAELLADAGVDFVIFDCTNGSFTWDSAYKNLLKVWKQAKNQGVNVPQITFMLNFAYSEDTYTAFMRLYKDLYNPNSSNYQKYNDLIFTFNGKPLILLHQDPAPSDMKKLLKNFEVRRLDGSYFIDGAQPNGAWGWLSAYPQAYYKKANNKPEQTTVGIAQNADYVKNQLTAMNGTDIMGRSYAQGDYSYAYRYKNQTITVGKRITGKTAKSTNTSLYGRNFQQQWDYAINIDPEIICVVGWNEWIMGRFEEWGGVKNAFVDEFNDEYSRDIEPSKGELKDYYYYQLVSNIRKYKGVTSQVAQNMPITINNTNDWNNSNIISYDHYVGGKTRNIKGYGTINPPTYVNKTFRNDIKRAKVSYDSSYIYFYVETVKKMSNYDSNNWMRLLIDTKKSTTNSDTNNWEEFEYIINRVKGTSKTLVLEKSKGGWNFQKIGNVSYKLNNNILEITIPRSYLGFTNNDISFNFKWCDNNLTNGDIMTIYTDGDAAPGGRFAFHFEGNTSYKEVTSIELGDINGDGIINSKDYILLKKSIIGMIVLTSKQEQNADVNGDGKINSLDYLVIKKKILNI